jgi:hypothetical protein
MRFSHEPGFSALSSSVSPEKNGKSDGRGIFNVFGCCNLGGEFCDEAVGEVFSGVVMLGSESLDESIVLKGVDARVARLSAQKLRCSV